MNLNIIQFDLADTGGNMLRWLRQHFSTHDPAAIVRPMRGDMQCFTDAPLSRWLSLSTTEGDQQEIIFTGFRPMPEKTIGRLRNANAE